MTTQAESVSAKRSAVAVLVACALALLFFGHLLDGRVYYPGDIARIYLPQRTALSRAMADGTLPWWTPYVGLGYPLLASGEAGAVYPLNWIVYRIFTPIVGLTVSLVLHYAIMGLGAYWFLRRVVHSRASALTGAIAFTFGGYSVAHLSHVSITTVSAWVPWMLYLTDRLLAREPVRRRWPYATGLMVVFALFLLGGHPQMWVLGFAPIACWALYKLSMRPDGIERSKRRAAIWLVCICFGVVIGLPQILPMAELSGLSERAGGIEGDFFTSYSFHPLLTATWFSPYVLGNPYPDGSIELMVYCGLLPLCFMTVAMRRPRHKLVWWLVALAGLGWLMALGRWNPLYGHLARVPLLNLFRVPARYLYWTHLAVCTLAALGMDTMLTDRAGEDLESSWLALPVLGAALATVVWASGTTLEQLVRAWRWLPLAGSAVAAALLVSRRRMARVPWAVACIVFLCADLYAFGAVLNRTYSATWPVGEIPDQPMSVEFLRSDANLYRTLTKDEIVPDLSVQPEALYPNMGLTYGIASANAYLPLTPVRQAEYFYDLDAHKLNILNIKYYLIPQLLPVDEASELYDVLNPFASIPTHRWLAIAPTIIDAVEVHSYTSHSAGLADGTLVARLLMDTSQGEKVIAIRVGLETAEWAYERDDVLRTIRHEMPEIATTFPARSGFPAREHAGHTYSAETQYGEDLRVSSVRIEPVIKDAFVRIESVLLKRGDAVTSLAHLVGLGDHRIAYRSEDVLIYRNYDVYPRAFLVPADAVVQGADGLRFVDGLSGIGAVQTLTYEPHHAVFEASCSTACWLVVSDLYYPGWHARVEGRPVEIRRMETVLRAIELTPGSHRVMLFLQRLGCLE